MHKIRIDRQEIMIIVSLHASCVAGLPCAFGVWALLTVSINRKLAWRPSKNPCGWAGSGKRKLIREERFQRGWQMAHRDRPLQVVTPGRAAITESNG